MLFSKYRIYAASSGSLVLILLFVMALLLHVCTLRTKRTFLRQPSGIRDDGANLEMTEVSLSPTHEDDKNLPTRAGGWPTFLPGKAPHTNHKPVYPTLHALNDEVDL